MVASILHNNEELPSVFGYLSDSIVTGTMAYLTFFFFFYFSVA